MAQIRKKFIGDNEVGAAKVRLENAEYLRGRNAADNADVDLLRLNSSNVLEVAAALNLLGTAQLSGQALATEAFVNSAVADFDFEVKAACRVATTGDAALSGLSAIDGVTPVANDRILVRAQAATEDNGIYLAAAGAWARSGDADTAAELSGGSIVVVTEGTVYADTVWIQSSPTPPVLGTDPVTWMQVGQVQLATNQKETFTLAGGDITNQYVDLANVARTDSIKLSVSGVMQYESLDYTVNYTGGAGGNTRVSFAGDLATAGLAALVAGDVLHVQYES